MVRHAEVHNPRDILYGRLPRFHLSSNGHQQAEQSARFLAGRPLAAIYTSPLLRARQTAGILTHYHPGLKPQTSRDLIEVRTGYEGKSNEVLKQGFSFYEPPYSPSDETMRQIFERMMRCLRHIIRKYTGESVAAVSHGDPIAITRIGLLGTVLTSAELHATVYPTRASINQIVVHPDNSIELAYFNVAGTTA